MFYKLILLCALFSAINSFPTVPLVRLPDGYIVGRLDTTGTNNTYFQFEKIPYASPPVGNLRFMVLQAPIPPEPWDGALITQDLDVMCYQSAPQDQESEDCLYLNVYSPQLPSADNNNVSLPVAVWIYGGGYTTGQGSKILYGPDYLLDQDIVVVTLNYRLGALGFLSTEDEVIPGNNGLKDQHLAIKWVHNNIKLFGGDPSRVIIFGESAGAGAISLQVLNKNNEGLFRGALASSGTSINFWSLVRNPRELAFELANLINGSFTSDNSTELLNYLQQVDPKNLNMITINDSQGLIPKAGPVIEVEHDGAVLTEKMFQLIKNGDFLRVPYLLGFNSEESLTFSSHGDDYDKNLTVLVPTDLATQIENSTQLLELGQTIKDYYSPNSTFQDNDTAAYRLFSDDGFIRGIIKHAQLASEFTDVFLYRFAYHGELGIVNKTVPGCDTTGHAEDVPYVWRNILTPDLSRFPTADLITHERLVRVYSNFIKHLNPTPEPDELLQNIQWPKVNFTTSGNVYYLNIAGNLTIETKPRNEMYQFWTSIYENFDDSLFATY